MAVTVVMTQCGKDATTTSTCGNGPKARILGDVPKPRPDGTETREIAEIRMWLTIAANNNCRPGVS